MTGLYVQQVCAAGSLPEAHEYGVSLPDHMVRKEWCPEEDSNLHAVKR